MTVRFNSLLRAVITAVALFAAIAFAWRGFKHPYFDLFSALLVLVLGMVLFWASGRFASKRPPAIVVTVVLLLFVQIRLAVLMVLPESLLHSGNVTAGMMNTMLLYLIAGTMACYVGLAAGYGSLPRKIPPPSATRLLSDVRYWILNALFLAAALFTLSTYLGFGHIGATGDGSGLGFFQRYVSRLVSPQALFIMSVVGYRMSSRRKLHRLVFYLLLAIYAAGFVVRGSRYGLFEIIVILLSAKLTFDGNFAVRINFAKLVAAALLPLLAVVMYVVPTQLREFWYGNPVTVNVAGSWSTEQVPQLVSDISYRLSFVEPTLFPANATELGLSDVSHLVNLKTSVLSSANRLIPGKPLGDILFSEYAFGYLYNPETGVRIYAANGRVDYVGYEWSIYGISYQLFGYVGGIAFIYGSMLLLGWILRHLQRDRSFAGRTYAVFAFMVLVMWLRNLGIDNFVDAVVHSLFLQWLYVVVIAGMRKRRPEDTIQPSALGPGCQPAS